MGYMRDGDDGVYFGKGARLHERAPALAAALAGVAPKVFVIDGSQISTLDGFYDEISRKLIPGARWGRSLDAFNDILRGGFGTPQEGFVLRWTHSTRSRETLGYPETVRCLELRLHECHPANREDVARKLEMAKSGKGATVFDWLVEIIKDHGAGGNQAADNVRLILT
jgi:RNAse (barnase) inhibitor barstar